MSDLPSHAEGVLSLLRGLCHRHPSPSCFVDTDLVIAYANPAFGELIERVWQRPLQAVLGAGVLGQLPWPRELRRAIAKVETSGHPERLYDFTLGRGAGVWDVALNPYIRDDGEPLGVLLTFETRALPPREDGRRWLDAAIANAQEAVAWVLPDGRVQLKNAEAARMFGLEAFAGAQAFELFVRGFTLRDVSGGPLPPDSQPFLRARSGLAMPPTVVRLERAGQAPATIEVRVTPLLSLAGEHLPVMVTAIDLSSALGRSPASLFAIAPLLDRIPLVIYALDRDTRLRFANAFFLERLGLPKERLLGRPLAEVLNLGEAEARIVRETLQSRQAVHWPAFRHRRADSGEVTYWQSSVTPLEGTPIAALIVATDVTWGVSLNHELSEKIEQLRAICDHIADAVLVARPEGEIVLANEAARALFQISAHATFKVLEQADIRDLADQPLAIADMPITRVLRGESVTETILKLHGSLGEERVVAASGTPILGADRHVELGVLAFHDVTDEFHLKLALLEKVKELQATLSSQLELERLKTDFLNNISHELRTPLTAIIGYTEFIEDGVVGPLNAQQQEFIHCVATNSSRLLQLINDLIDVARLEAGKLHFAAGALNFEELVSHLLPGYQSMAAAKNITISAERACRTLPLVRADQARLTQVLSHLVDNALKFTPEGGEVTIRCCADSAHEALIEIIDNGIGIPKEALPHLFSKFYQVESGLRRAQGGAGLGLALSKLLVEAQGGRIGVESEPGRGTRVWFTVPFYEGA